jgi:syntaxin-binding protein 1
VATHPWLQDQVSGKLDPAGFPYVKDYPQSTPAASSARPAMTPTTSLRSAKPSWHRAARTGGPAVENRQRLLVFVAGGMTYSEMRDAYLLSSQLGKDIIVGAVAHLIRSLSKADIVFFFRLGGWWWWIGSTHTLTPRQFIDDLKVLDLSGVGSRALPNGLREMPAARPYQAFYDERYFTRDAPPPQQQQPQQQQRLKAPPLGKSVSARSIGKSGADLSLTSSHVSVNSSYTPSSTNGGKEKEKKRRFLGF